ncbi:MAG: reverse transcriptase-like protein, partial [Allobaculum sp.]|nr:reverse transcriptase-like protein [Allobaculum sp.]
NYAYIDGSFNPFTKVYGGGGILVDQFGNKHILFESGNNPKLAEMRNVAGEILGARLVIRKALELGMGKLSIFHDYEGISKWPTGKWRCKKKETKDYAQFVIAAIGSGLKIYWHHVKGHSGVRENEEVDKLAKMVVGVK